MTSKRVQPPDPRRRSPARSLGSLRITGRSRRIGQIAREAVGAACQVDLEQRDGASWLTVSGQLDVSCGDRFIARLREVRDTEPAPEALVIDLRGVTFIDSTGLSLLLKADGVARQNQFALHVVRSRVEIVRAVMEATGVEKFLPLLDEPPELG